MKKKLSVEFEEYWPLWPEGGQGEELTNVYVGCGFNHLVDLQWGSRSQFQAEVQKEAGFVDFQRTEWIDDIEDLPCLPGGFDWSVEPSGSQPGSGMLDYSSKIRKVRFDNGGGAAFLGQFFKTEEVQRCREYIPGERMVVEACVCTTAPFCEKFRVICRYITERIREDACRIKIEFYITYVKQVNPMTKVFMEKGARGGLTKNFEIYVQTLSSFISLLPPEAVDEIQDLVPLPSSSAIPSPENHGREHPPSCRQSTFIDWGKFASPSVRQALEPHVDRMKTSLTKNPAIPTFFSHDFSAPPVVHIACIIIFLVLVKVLLMSLRGIGSIMGLTDPTSTLVDLLFQVFDLPDSIGEVLAAAVVLEGAHWLINMLADIAKENHLDTSEPVKQTVAPFQNPIMSQSDFQEPPPSSSGSSRIVPDPKSPAKMSTPSSPRKSELIQEGASSLVEDGGLESAGEVGGEEKEPEAEFVEPPPSFIENTVSFFRLGMVATALAVDIAISGMKGKKPQNFSHKEQSNQDNEGGLLEENTEETPTTVLEEVFENERLQPFRGWGHTWPGHFLPTDKCGHWSLRDQNVDGWTSMHFKEVESEIPEGWAWDDPEWKIDRSGLEEEAVDPGGWQYGVDFSWLKHPPEPGSGKRAGKFVRRRRWIRSRSLVSTSRRSSLCIEQPSKSSLENQPRDQPVSQKVQSLQVSRLSEGRSSRDGKALSETSYFAGRSILGSFSTDMMNRDTKKRLGSTQETLHRRHSSGETTMERYFSLDDGLSSWIRTLPLGSEVQDQVSNGDQPGGPELHSPNTENGHIPKSFRGCRDQKTGSMHACRADTQKNPISELGVDLEALKLERSKHGREKKYWSDSETATPRRVRDGEVKDGGVRDGGPGRFVIPSYQLQEKGDDAGAQGLQNVAANAKCQTKKKINLELPNPRRPKLSLSFCGDEEEEDSNWFSMEGGKWVEDCLTPNGGSSIVRRQSKKKTSAKNLPRNGNDGFQGKQKCRNGT